MSPTIVIIFGVTGDLAAKKILPALFNLYQKQMLGEHFAIVGFGRKTLSNSDFHDLVKKAVRDRLTDVPDSLIEPFFEKLSYRHGTFDEQESYEQLSTYLRSIEKSWDRENNYLFYLSVPPTLYEPILRNIRGTKLYRQDHDTTESRVLVEKPIGKDLASAEMLEELLTTNFREQEIYRIDHYLAKEMLQNILTFRFANNLFEKSWNSDSIDKIELRLWETLGVEHRGNFYDGLGALRDVGQNHLLQMLALITMDPPMDFDAGGLHLKRAMVLYKLKPVLGSDITTHTYRAQYRGYLDIDGVLPESKTETYFKIKCFIDDVRWQGVPIFFESGKRMHEQRKEIVVTYKHPVPCFCAEGNHVQNTITFSLEPTEGITINFWSKKPGLAMVREARTMDFMLRQNDTEKAQYIEEYEKLLLDSIHGDQTLFVSAPEIKAMWAFTDPIIKAWGHNVTPLGSYTPDTNEALTNLAASAAGI